VKTVLVSMSMGEDSACIYEYGWRQCLYLWVWSLKTLAPGCL